jgi:hypothetical protein
VIAAQHQRRDGVVVVDETRVGGATNGDMALVVDARRGDDGARKVEAAVLFLGLGLGVLVAAVRVRVRQQPLHEQTVLELGSRRRQRRRRSPEQQIALDDGDCVARRAEFALHARHRRDGSCTLGARLVAHLRRHRRL